MAQKKITNAQYTLVFNTEITAEDIGDELVIDVPPNFILTGAALAVRTVFNGTTPTVSMVDNKETPTEYLDGVSLGTATATVVSTGLYSDYPGGGKLSLTIAHGATAPTAGRADLIVQGIIRGRQNERIGANAAT